MKKIFVLDVNGVKLFEGTRHDAKQFIKKNRIGRYRLVETFDEKVVTVPETTTLVIDLEPTLDEEDLDEDE